MKKWIRCLAVTMLISLFSTPLLAADKTTSTSDSSTATSTASSSDSSSKAAKVMSMSSILQQLQKAGYIVKSADYSKDDSVYKVEAVDRHGEKQSLDINAATGLTPEQKKVPNETSIAQAAKKLEKNGAVVTYISTDSNGYKVTVADSKGNQQDYVVDMQTGKVSQ